MELLACPGQPFGLHLREPFAPLQRDPSEHVGLIRGPVDLAFEPLQPVQLHARPLRQVIITGARHERMWKDEDNFGDPAVMWEWALDPDTGRASERQLDGRGCEFPRIDDRLTGDPSSIAYCAADHAILRYDLNAGTSSVHDFGADSPGEATFVPAASGSAESAEYLMTYLYRPESNTSDLLIIDAADVAAEPLAAIHLPQRVPSGFHGNWFDD